MLKIAEMEYSGANSIFLRVFFDKKYALPYRVIDAVVFHFLRFIFIDYYLAKICLKCELVFQTIDFVHMRIKILSFLSSKKILLMFSFKGSNFFD
jgi:hypothetical protein